MAKFMQSKKANPTGLVWKGTEYILPGKPEMHKDTTIDEAIDFLKHKKNEMEQVTTVIDNFDVYPWDGAIALQRCMKEMFGTYVEHETVAITVEVAYKKFEEVKWGSFILPGIEGLVATQRNIKDGKLTFVLTADVRRKDKPGVQELFKRVREYLKDNSIYRGKAVELQTTEDGDIDVEKPPRFMNLSNVVPEELVLDEYKYLAVNANLFSLIQHHDAAVAVGIPKKQVVLLEGPHGTGKTFIGLIAALLSTQNDRTAFMVNDVRALPAAVEMARIYGKSLVFAG